MKPRVIALDADGVLLDYNTAYAGAWERAFGERPVLRNPNAYWPMDRWAVARLIEPERREHFRKHFDDSYWSTVPALDGAVQACERLVAAGFELVCVTALPAHFGEARRRNIQAHGFPISEVIATGHEADGVSPKAAAIGALQPLAFVDDFLPYHRGMPAGVHKALILREPEGSPNVGEELSLVDSQHQHLAAFADWWLARPDQRASGNSP